MDGKAIQVELYDNVLEAVGIVKFEYDNSKYLLYSLNEEIDSNGEKLDKIYVSEVDAPVPQRIPDPVYDRVKEIITAMGETIDLNLNDFKILLIDKDKYKVAEPRKLGTHKYMCKEILRKYKKLEEETKMNQEAQAQAQPMFVDPSMVGTEPTTETTEQVQTNEPTQNAFNMAPPAADQLTPAQPTQAQPVVESVNPVQPAVTEPAPVQATPVAETATPVQPVEAVQAAPVQPAPTFIDTAVPASLQSAPVQPAPAEVTPVEPVAPVNVVETAPVAQVEAAPAVTNEMNPEVKGALDTLFRVYNNDKAAIINEVNNYTPQISAVETSDINLNNIPVVPQNDQTDAITEKEFTGQIPVVNEQMATSPVEATPVVETVTSSPVEVTPVNVVEPTVVAPVEVTPVNAVEPTVVAPVEPVVQPAPVSDSNAYQATTTVAPVEPVAPVQDTSVQPVEQVSAPVAPVINPLNPTEAASIDISALNNEQTNTDEMASMNVDRNVTPAEGQTNKVVGFGYMDGQPNNAVEQGGQQLAA